jgi:hypothetical protein
LAGEGTFIFFGESLYLLFGGILIAGSFPEMEGKHSFFPIPFPFRPEEDGGDLNALGPRSKKTF